MKAFSFRLEQVLHWRETQVNIEKARVATAASRLAGIEVALEERRSELSTAAAGILDRPTGGTLESYAGLRESLRARIRDLEAQALVAQRTLTLGMNRLIEANQRLRLIENLRRAGQGRWRREFDRELAAIADEAFLWKIHSKIQSKDGRARSSGG